MYLRVVLLLGLTIIPLIFEEIKADDVKKKRVIIKIPKRIQHIYHHHTKKIHIRKPKPKQVVHVVEEVDPIGKEWLAIQSKFPIPKYKKPSKLKYKPRYNSWRSQVLDHEYDYDDEDEYEDDYKEASYNKEFVWKGRGGRNREQTRGKWNSDRGKRHKDREYYHEREELPPRGHWKEESRQRPNRVKAESSRRPNGNGGLKTKPTRDQRPRRPIEKGFPNYDEYVEVGGKYGTWPEKKEHISWHLNGKTPLNTVNDIQADYDQKGSYNTNMYSNHKYKVEQNFVGDPMPDIPVVPPPQFNLQQLAALGPPQVQATTVFSNLQTQSQQQKPIQDQRNTFKKNSNMNKSQGIKKDVKSGLGVNNSGNNLSYSSHVGHTDGGTATSFQYVQFGRTSRKNVN